MFKIYTLNWMRQIPFFSFYLQTVNLLGPVFDFDERK